MEWMGVDVDVRLPKVRERAGWVIRLVASIGKRLLITVVLGIDLVPLVWFKKRSKKGEGWEGRRDTYSVPGREEEWRLF